MGTHDFDDIPTADIFDSDFDKPLVNSEPEVSVKGEEDFLSGEEVVFSDNDKQIDYTTMGDSDSSSDMENIIEDKETEQIVVEKIKQETSRYSKPEKEDGSFFDESDTDESITLSSEEMSNILEDTPEEPVSTSVEEPRIQSSGISEEPVMESLEDIPEVSGFEEEPTETLSEEDVSLHEVPQAEEIKLEDSQAQLEEVEPLSSETPEETIPVMTEEEPFSTDALDTTLSEEPSLESIPELEEEVPTVSLDDEIPVIESSFEEPETADTQKEEGFFEDVEDESISLSGDELDNILKTAEVAEEPEDSDEQPAEVSQEVSAQVELEQIDLDKGLETLEEPSEDMGVQGPETISTDEITVEEEIPPLEEGGVLEEAPVSALEPVKKEDLKKVLRHLDAFLDNLPDNVIREFAQSEYYLLYKKILQQLGV
ncbi:MAG: hypothetical protein JW827_04255 [Spirochaetes bacterium]|nr:hypothetical protein [Spirochaetota bacterium]